ncbi:MAG: acetyl-CoA carboxylase biotin carboxylase subunit [Planctomycetes bacterium]|nr:acetyl-CoA carboxylase biotin carboxylase subunit [Planctomycetota bacterium]
MFRKILIANRGEIAVRVLRACRELDVPAVAVYSEADRLALHVRLAREAVAIGPPHPGESYLRIDKILAAAKTTGADAIHPGYGFLAENAGFARQCEDAGITFIGPDSRSIERMGSKLEARRTVIASGAPVVPGATVALESDAELAARAREVGFPVVLKASGGGGGKGMRVVTREEDLASAFRLARSEAERAFADGTLYLERYLESPRHVEVQVAADVHGGVVHLGERECSLQRRHQKILEESPSPALSPELRHRMTDAAVAIVRAAGYQNVGTIEFLVDRAGSFFFLEMNTRLQVEHPVTEMVTGIDLVKLQIRLAAGERLPFTQQAIAFRGHAMEARICAEDPDNGFVPSIGVITELELPGGPHVRVDSALYAGLEVSPFYDPLIGKVIVWAETRDACATRLRGALGELHVGGVRTTAPLLVRVLGDARFLRGEYDTGFLPLFQSNGAGVSDDERFAAAIAAALRRHRDHHSPAARAREAKAADESPWAVFGRRSQMRRRAPE